MTRFRARARWLKNVTMNTPYVYEGLKFLAAILVFFTYGMAGHSYFGASGDPFTWTLDNLLSDYDPEAVEAWTVEAGLDPSVADEFHTFVWSLKVVALTIVAILTALIAAPIITKKLREGTGIKPHHLDGHVILWGFGAQGLTFLHELAADENTMSTPVVVVVKDRRAAEETIKRARFPWDFFVCTTSWEGTYNQALRAANIDKASHLVVLGVDDESESVLLTVEARKLRKDIHVVVLVKEPGTRDLIRTSGADEVISSDEVAAVLSASSVLNPGITSFYNEALSFIYGNEFYLLELPESFRNTTFEDLLIRLKSEHNAIPLAILRGKDVFTNPLGMVVEPGDKAIVLSEGITHL